jgi:prepilin-type processing-associated H-X9-DG protein
MTSSVPLFTKGTGVVYWRSQLPSAKIPDGHSKTYFATEYFWSFNPEQPTLGENYYGIGTPLGGGYLTTAAHAPMKDNVDTSALAVQDLGRAGSAHPASFNVAFCDGHVQALDYDIEIAIHRSAANRADRH